MQPREHRVTEPYGQDAAMERARTRRLWYRDRQAWLAQALMEARGL